MIHWKISALSIALGATATLGFVWLGGRARKRAHGAAAPLVGVGEDTSNAALGNFASDEARTDALRDFDADEVARADAMHDLFDASGTSAGNSELDFTESGGVDGEPLDSEPMEVRSLDEEALSGDEPYDALDPESIGNEFLRRATGASSSEVTAPSLFDSPADAAVELPVGSVDADGTTELHEPRRPSRDAIDLSPNDDELAHRAAEAGERPSKPNG